MSIDTEVLKKEAVFNTLLRTVIKTLNSLKEIQIKNNDKFDDKLEMLMDNLEDIQDLLKQDISLAKETNDYLLSLKKCIKWSTGVMTALIAMGLFILKYYEDIKLLIQFFINRS